MNLIQITPENLETEHICCAISNERDCQVQAKKAWLAKRLEEGLVFLKGDVRGKCFIEYIPAEHAWAPIEAEGYMYIDCLWVSGQFKGHGYSSLLLDECIRDAKEKGRRGLAVLSSEKKLGYLSDPKYLKYKGFQTTDAAGPHFRLMALPFEGQTELPRFSPRLQQAAAQVPKTGLVLYYTSQCPFTAKYVPLLEAICRDRNVPIQTFHITTTEQAQNAPCPYTAFSLYWNGGVVTHEIPSEKKFEKLLADLGL